MGEELAPSGQAYTYTLLNKWEQIIELAEIYRKNLLFGREDQHTQVEYVAKLTRLWLEFVPKVKGRDEFGDIVPEFESFRKYYLNPNLLLQQGGADDIFRLEELIRIILERLRVTQFEKTMI